MKLSSLFTTLSACVLFTISVAANATIITVDNTDAGFTSSGLTNSTYENGFFGTNYMADARNVSGDFAIWDPTASSDWLAGIWKVEIFWTTGNTRANNAAVTVDSGSASSSLTINQLLDGKVWNDLGDFRFNLNGASVKLDDSNSTASQNIIADAVRFTFISAAPAEAAVPAPGTLLLLLTAAAGLYRLRRK